MKSHSDPLRIPSAALTRHAACRGQQRSIPKAIVDLLIDFGDSASSGNGTQRYAFSKRSWRAAAAYLGPGAKHYSRYRATYIVVSDGCVITAGWIH
jgi:hypothetical protein